MNRVETERSNKSDRPTPASPVAVVLAEHQTAFERNSGALHQSGCDTPVQLRTCYLPELEDACQEMMDASGHDNVTTEFHVLDDEARYGASSGAWDRVLLRMPWIPTPDRWEDSEEGRGGDEDTWEGDPDEGTYNVAEHLWQQPVIDAYQQAITLLYLIDEQAAREGLVRILWLDRRGRCVWDNRILAGDVEDFQWNLSQRVYTMRQFMHQDITEETWARGAIIVPDLWGRGYGREKNKTIMRSRGILKD